MMGSSKPEPIPMLELKEAFLPSDEQLAAALRHLQSPTLTESDRTKKTQQTLEYLKLRTRI